MPFFGLVWVASWVGCFFSSSHDLLKTPSPLPHLLSTQELSKTACRKGLCTILQSQVESQSTEPFSGVIALSALQTGIANAVQGNFLPEATSLKAASWLNNLPLFRYQANSLGQPKPPTPSQPFQKQAAAIAPIRAFQVSRIKQLPQTLKQGFQLFSKPVAVFQEKKRLLSNPLRSWQFTNGAVAPLPKQSLTQTPSNQPSAWFGIQFNGFTIAEVSTPQQARKISHRLQKVLNQPGVNADQIQPAMVQDKPAIMLGDRLLFTIDEAVCPNQACSLELLAIHWANNLRIALGKSPIPTTTTQETIYRLQETTQKLAGLASWYGPNFHGKATATGETFDQNDFTAAHPSLPFDTYLKVTNLKNGKSVIVRVNDRGPYFDNRILDLSLEAARTLESDSTGVIPIEAIVMQPTRPQTPAQQTLARL